MVPSLHYRILTYELPVESLKIVHEADSEPYINYYLGQNSPDRICLTKFYLLPTTLVGWYMYVRMTWI